MITSIVLVVTTIIILGIPATLAPVYRFSTSFPNVIII